MSSTAGMEARIQKGAMHAVVWANVLGIFNSGTELLLLGGLPRIDDIVVTLFSIRAEASDLDHRLSFVGCDLVGTLGTPRILRHLLEYLSPFRWKRLS